MIKVVCNASPIIALSQIGHLNLLYEMRAKELGRINSFKPLLDELIANDFRISEKLYLELLDSVDEK